MKTKIMRRFGALLTAASLLVCGSILTSPVFSQTVNPAVDDYGREDIPYVGFDNKYSCYDGTFEVYNFLEAQQAGIPEGYEDYVMVIRGSDAAGVTVDFSEYGIPTSIIKSLTIRVLCEEGTKAFRVTHTAGTSWTINSTVTSFGTWETYTVTDQALLAGLADGNGYLGRFNVGFRFTSAGNHRGYVDCVKVELMTGDSNPPVITYNGETEIYTTCGKPFFADVSAYDADEKRNVPLTPFWSEGAIDADGLLLPGDHTVRLVAVDSFDNQSVLKLTLHVGEKDTEPPVIGYAPDNTHIIGYAGMLLSAVIPIADNSDPLGALDVTCEWDTQPTDGSLRLVEGTYTLTVTAQDLTGNRAVRVYTLTVRSASDFPTDFSIDESR